MKKFFIVAFLFLQFFLSTKVLAADCIETSPNMNSTDLTAIVDACTNKLAANQNDQSTLKQAITALTTKVTLAQAQINQTISQINNLEKEITVLSGVLDTVNQSMDDLSKIYIARVRESYRRSRVNPLDVIFSSTSFGDYLTKLKYLNTIKAKDQLILSELENSRLDYNQRKQETVTKQREVESLKTKLESQKKILSRQQQDKQNLLTLTQNDEKKFEALLRQANAQIAAMRGFTSGATPLNNQTHCDNWGCYYNQRDAQWFYNTIGLSSETIGRVGCLITSAAMVASHYGKSLKPSDIAASTNPFFGNTAYMVFNSWSVGGVTLNRTPIGVSHIDDEINAGRPVIAGLNALSGTHFIVLKGKNDQGYIMDDPYMENGYDKPFLSTYSMSQIFNIDKVTVN